MDYVRDTRVGHFARNLSRDVQKNTFPLLVVFAGIAGTCIAAALRSQRKLACRESANAMMSGPASAGQPEQFVAHEGWGVEKIREPLG
jgi:hypothetical protein